MNVLAVLYKMMDLLARLVLKLGERRGPYCIKCWTSWPILYEKGGRRGHGVLCEKEFERAQYGSHMAFGNNASPLNFNEVDRTWNALYLPIWGIFRSLLPAESPWSWTSNHVRFLKIIGI